MEENGALRRAEFRPRLWISVVEWRVVLLRPRSSSFHLLLRQKVEPKGAHDPSGEPHHTGRHTSRSAAATRIVDTYRTHPADTSRLVRSVLRIARLECVPTAIRGLAYPASLRRIGLRNGNTVRQTPTQKPGSSPGFPFSVMHVFTPTQKPSPPSAPGWGRAPCGCLPRWWCSLVR